MTTAHAISSDSRAVTKWSLATLLSGWVDIEPAADAPVGSVTLDSRKVVEGSLFIALEGSQLDGLDYADAAVASGAPAILIDAKRSKEARVKSLCALGVQVVPVPDLKQRVGQIAARFFDNPSDRLKILGVTGTDGKTSVCDLLSQALAAHGSSCATIGTLGARSRNTEYEFGLTTPDAVQMQEMLSRFEHEDVSSVAMEVSSHALDQFRVGGVGFNVAVFTNLGRDHLDYHGTLETYRSAKEKLFLFDSLDASVINVDDPVGAGLVEKVSKQSIYTFGQSMEFDARSGSRHIGISSVVTSEAGLEFCLSFEGKVYPVAASLLGRFNVYNLTAVFGALLALGIEPSECAELLPELRPVEGRVQRFTSSNGVTAIVDYAHNPHALKSLLAGIRDHVIGRLILVFGCGGDRDTGKRALMAEVAEQYADFCIVTDDNPRFENGDDIIANVTAGFSGTANYKVQRDRAAAIELAIAAANSGDWVVVAGKGHERYQIINGVEKYFSDAEVVSNFVDRAEVSL